VAAERFIEALGPDARAAFEALGARRRFAAGTPLFLEGDVGGSVITIESGHVKVFVTSGEGREIMLAVRGPGALLGDLSAIDGAPRSASGTALDAVEATVIPSAAFRTFLADTPGAALALLGMVIDRMRDSDRLRVELGARDTYGRVAQRLVELAETSGVLDGDAIRIALPLTQDELAGWVVSSREAVARSLASLRRRGLITTARREIRVVDLEGLRDAAK
jgi:CRP-like cAMP-binding protein